MLVVQEEDQLEDQLEVQVEVLVKDRNGVLIEEEKVLVAVQFE